MYLKLDIILECRLMIIKFYQSMLRLYTFNKNYFFHIVYMTYFYTHTIYKYIIYDILYIQDFIKIS